jgi:DNA polymerase II small subunit
MNEQEIIDFYIDNDILISPELLLDLKNLQIPINTKYTVINKDVLNILSKKIDVDVVDLEKALVLKQKHHDSKLYEKFIEYLKEDLSQQKTNNTTTSNNIKDIGQKNVENITTSLNKIQTRDIDSTFGFDEDFLKRNKIKIVSNYTSKTKKWSVNDFVGLYNSRYKELEKILRSRTELQGLTSISRISAKKERENVALIGFVYEKGLTKAGNIMLTIEDPTGFIKVVVTKVKEELFKLAEEIQLDEIIGVTGMCDQIVFANNLFIPDIPLTKELKKSPEEGYFVLISDPQVGNKRFLEKEFNKFLAWINGEIGNDKQREIASKVKYVFIAGDLVEGVGIYPDQEYDLAIIDIRKQYEAVAELLKKIPTHLPIIFCLGNHDVGRMSEPQPPLTGEYAQPLLDLPNVISLSNPSTVNIYAQPDKGFEGLDVMLYHGGSFFYYINNVLSIRRNGAYKRSDLVMKYLLQRRHLAPSHTSTLYIPDSKKDPLLIDKVPDFLFSGHIHRSTVNNYRNVTCINASCWTAKSPEQERRGLEPQPARAFIIDMQTREVKIMNFLSKEDQEKEQQALEDEKVIANG